MNTRPALTVAKSPRSGIGLKRDGFIYVNVNKRCSTEMNGTLNRKKNLKRKEENDESKCMERYGG